MVPNLSIDPWCGSLQLPVPGGRIQEPPAVLGEHDPAAAAEEESHRGGVHLHQLWVTHSDGLNSLHFAVFSPSCMHAVIHSQPCTNYFKLRF